MFPFLLIRSSLLGHRSDYLDQLIGFEFYIVHKQFDYVFSADCARTGGLLESVVVGWAGASGPVSSLCILSSKYFLLGKPLLSIKD